MKRLNKLLPALAVLSMAVFPSCAGVTHQGGTGIDKLVYKPINTELPKTKRVKLSNGMIVRLLPDHELPLFNIHAIIGTGSRWEPAEKTGLASITGATIRSGGTMTRPPDELDETLEHVAASVETSIGSEYGTASLSVLSRDIDIGLELFADVLRNPAFEKSRFELARAQALDGIRKKNDNPTGIASRELNKIVYKGTPYGREATVETVKSITREDAIAFHKKYFVPQNIMLGVTGDFNEKEILAKLNDTFKGFSGPDPDFPRVKKAQKDETGGVYLAKKDILQSVIRMGHLSIKRTDPDYYAMRVMNSILGGSGFSSRLVRKVRTDYGLAYSVWSYHFGGRMEFGNYILGTETKSASTAQAIGLILDEARRIRDEKVTEEELNLAKDTIVNSFIFIFDSPNRIMDQLMTVDYYDYPEGYLENYRDNIIAVTVDDVQRVARKYLKPDQLKIVVVGDPEKFDRSLEEFGPVELIELRD